MEQKLDWNAKLLRFFFERKRLVALIILVILVGGTFSLASLRREGFPSVPVKVVAIQTLYPGAPAEEMESQVTKPIESAVKDAKGLKETSSTSSNSFSNVILTFEESANIDQAVQDVQSKVQSAKSNLPKDAESPKVSTFNTGGPSFFFGVYVGDDINQTRAEAKKLADELSTVAGVKSANVTINPKNRITIDYHEDALSQNGVSLSTINQILQAASVNLPVGTLQSDKSESITSVGSYNSVEDIQNLIVGVNPKTMKPILLKDVADVQENKENLDSIERFGFLDGGTVRAVPGSFIEISVTNTADIIKTQDKIFSKIDSLKSDNVINKSTKVVALYDQGEWTKNQIGEILSGAIGKKVNLFLLGGLQLLFIAMLIFVNWRSALVASLAIPFSMAITFLSLKATGTQLNTMVLFSLILVLGLIVDPAIVMVEAFQRYLDLKYDPNKAILEAGRRYGASLFMAVLTSILVFLPFGVVSGILGAIIKYIPLTILPALIASYFVPIAILPFISQKILKGKSGGKVEVDEAANLSKPAIFFMSANKWILARVYREALVLIISFVLVIASCAIVALKKVPIVQFSQPEDNPTMQVSAIYAKGLSFAKKDEGAKQVEESIAKEKGIKDFFYINQNQDGFTLYIDLVDKKDRTADQGSKKIKSRIEDSIKSIAEFSDITAAELSIGPPTSDYQIQVQLADNDINNLKKAATETGKFLSRQSHVIKVDDGFTGKADPGVEIVLNREKVGSAGLSSFEVGTQLKSVLDEVNVGKYLNSTDGEQEDIFLVNSKKFSSIDEIKSVPLISRDGKTFTVGDVAQVEQKDQIDTIERYNGSRFVTIKARVDDSQKAIDVQNNLNKFLTPAKLKEWNIDQKLNKGDMADMTKSFTELATALAIAVLLTYIVLVLQFGSFSYPVIMLFTIPLSFIGVFPALWATKSSFGFLELVGITILVGIVENVAIFLIDYANQLRRERNISAKEAIIISSGVRFRPILLTKLVALGGLLPLAIESEFWRGLSVVIIAGIGLSGFFSLVTIPVLYVWISKLQEKLHKRASRQS